MFIDFARRGLLIAYVFAGEVTNRTRPSIDYGEPHFFQQSIPT